MLKLAERGILGIHFGRKTSRHLGADTGTVLKALDDVLDGAPRHWLTKDPAHFGSYVGLGLGLPIQIQHQLTHLLLLKMLEKGGLIGFGAHGDQLRKDASK